MSTLLLQYNNSNSFMSLAHQKFKLKVQKKKNKMQTNYNFLNLFHIGLTVIYLGMSSSS